MNLRRIAWLALALWLAGGASRVYAQDATSWGNTSAVFGALPYILAWLFPLGIAMVAVGMSGAARAQRVATSLPLALAAALLGYYVSGFAFHLGGIGLIMRHSAFAELVAEWSPLDLRLGPGWGFMGLRGFALSLPQDAGEQAFLFISQLPWVTVAALIPLTTLEGRMPRLPAFLLALLVSAVLYPLAGNWVQGGGWLSQLGATLDLGHGLVDYGLGSAHLVGAGAALAALVAFRHRPADDPPASPELPTAYLPLNLLLGAVLAWIGWMVLALAPTVAALPAAPSSMLLNALMAVAGSSLATLFYGWAARGEPDAGLTGRGILAGLVAVAPGLPFMPPWAAALTGGLVGLFLAPWMYFVDHKLHLDDAGAAVSVHGISAVWGLLAAGLFSDGRHGQSWNSLGAVGEQATSSGVTGLLFATSAGLNAGQLYAQAIGVLALTLLAFVIPWLVLSLLARAYVLPGVMREAARQRAHEERLKREAHERRKRLGLETSGLVRGRAAYLHWTAASALRLRGRPRAAQLSSAAGRPSPSAPRLRAMRLTWRKRP
jgi:Amt family ammonium transporter